MSFCMKSALYPWFYMSFTFNFSARNVLAVTVGLWESWTRIGLVKIPLTSFLKWSWLIPFIRPSGATLIPSGSPSPSTSTERCVGWHLLGGRVVVLARATNSTTLLVAHVVLPGEDAIPCSCIVTVNSCKCNNLIKLMQVVEFNKCFCCFLLCVEKCRILQEFRCFRILRSIWKCRLIFVNIVGPEHRVLWVSLWIRTKRDMCSVNWKPHG